jgi:hypothetical protein
MTIGNILWPFGKSYSRLVQFVVICYIFPVLVRLDQEKSGNPASPSLSLSLSLSLHEINASPSRKKVSLSAE